MNGAETRAENKAKNRDWLLPVSGLGFVAAYFGARLVFKIPDLNRAVYFLTAFLPAVAFLAFAWALAGVLRTTDEIHLEALAIAWPLAVGIVMTISLLQKAGFLAWEPVWVYLPMTYYFGLFVTWRRYQ